MLASLKKANELLQKELNDYYNREAEMKKREEELDQILIENQRLQDEIDKYADQAKEFDQIDSKI